MRNDLEIILTAINSQTKIAEDRNEDDIDNSGGGGDLFELRANEQRNVEIHPNMK